MSNTLKSGTKGLLVAVSVSAALFLKRSKVRRQFHPRKLPRS
jgi:hypothetical protein